MGDTAHSHLRAWLVSGPPLATAQMSPGPRAGSCRHPRGSGPLRLVPLPGLAHPPQEGSVVPPPPALTLGGALTPRARRPGGRGAAADGRPAGASPWGTPPRPGPWAGGHLVLEGQDVLPLPPLLQTCFRRDPRGPVGRGFCPTGCPAWGALCSRVFQEPGHPMEAAGWSPTSCDCDDACPRAREC